jgi:signal recognition particle receptor subunit beta
VYGPALPSHASSQTNTSELVLADGRPLRLVDVPGHPRIRGQFAEHLAGAKALVFVVDANTVSRSGPAVAESVSSSKHQIAR